MCPAISWQIPSSFRLHERTGRVAVAAGRPWFVVGIRSFTTSNWNESRRRDESPAENLQHLSRDDDFLFPSMVRHAGSGSTRIRDAPIGQ